MPSRPIQGIRGERVYLRSLEPEDAAIVHGWYADARVRSLMGDPPVSLARLSRRYADAVTGDGDDVFRFLICRLEDDVPVGRTDIFEIDRQNGSCAFGITIGDPDLWGTGLGTDAVNALVDFAFGQLRLERVWLDTDAHNERAQAAYRKAGFSVEGRLRHAFFQDGEWSDDIRMAILRDEWAALARPRSWELMAREVEARTREGEGAER
jgi:RimJ/RimL family protein N-acetyltransferase